jgi:hypothetical protein
MEESRITSFLSNTIAFSPKTNRQFATGCVNATIVTAVVGMYLNHMNWPVLPSSRLLTSVSILSSAIGLGAGALDPSNAEKCESNDSKFPAYLLIGGAAANLLILGWNGSWSHFLDTTFTVRSTQFIFASLISAGVSVQIARAIKFSGIGSNNSENCSKPEPTSKNSFRREYIAADQ